MTPKTSTHIIKGMQKDTSKSKLSKEFAFDAKNIRITAREEDSLLSVTNEKGNMSVANLRGNYLGHCVLNNQIVVFIKKDNSDCIFLYSDYNENTNLFHNAEPLYEGNLNFNLNNPIESLGVYENEKIQKIYWVDGLNQPRVINIKEEVKSKWTNTSFDFIPELTLQESVSVEAISNSSMFAPGVIQYAFSYYNKYGQESNIFNVTPLCYILHKGRGASPEEIIKDIAFKIRIDNVDTNFDYIRIYSIHRTSLDAVPNVKKVIDMPITKENNTKIYKGVSSYSIGSNRLYLRRLDDLVPDNPDYNNRLVSEVFYPPVKEEVIELKGDKRTIKTYEFTRILQNDYDLIIGNYENDVLNIEEVISADFSNLQYIETKTSIYDRDIYTYQLVTKDNSDSIIIDKIDNNNIPYIEYIDSGILGESIDPAQLLYIGGEEIIASTITQKEYTLFLGNLKLNKPSIPEEIKSSLERSIILSGTRDVSSKADSVSNHFTEAFINTNSYYRAGEHYRLGIQFQYKNGSWSEPVYINDTTQSIDNRPIQENNVLTLPSFTFTLNAEIRRLLYSYGFKRMRGLVVYPNHSGRKVITQGMLCPTIFSPEDRENNNPYAQSSWFLRPYLPFQLNDENEDGPFGFNNDLDNISNGASVEFRHGFPITTGPNRGSEIQNEVEYKIDQSILNLYSPDIEFDSLDVDGVDNIKMRIVGIINFTSNYGDIDIQTKTGPLAPDALGFSKKEITNTTDGGTGLISGVFYNDQNAYSNNNLSSDKYFLVYPWHRNGSLNSDDATLANYKQRAQSAFLEKKKISNYKFSKANTWLDKNSIWEAYKENSKTSLANGISKIKKFDSNQTSLLKIEDNYYKYNINYFGNIDTLLTSSAEGFGIYAAPSWEEKLNSVTSDSNTTSIIGKEPVRLKYKTSPHLVFKLNPSTSKHEIILPNINNINSLNNSDRITNIKIEYPEYGALALFDQEEMPPKPITNVNDLWVAHQDVGGYEYFTVLEFTGVMWRRYDGTNVYSISGNVIKIYEKTPRQYGTEYIWELLKTMNINDVASDVTSVCIKQDTISLPSLKYPYLYLAELYRDGKYVNSAFGGNTEEAIKNNLWLPAGPSVSINSGSITYEYGDTRYQRYDCLKTYAFTPEDENQVIEIASFMCETRVNMLGRYDKNIGNLSNLNADPVNFNLFNPIYSQKDNFFNYRILDDDFYKLNNFPNSITWSKIKHLGEDVDTWTNITMANTLDLDGDKGKINKLLSFNDNIYAFQDNGINNILFNSRVQIPTSDGVPIEISNGYKLEGNRYISSEVGCQNKYSIQVTPSGIYFLDSESSSIYLLGENGLTNLSINNGFDIWTKEVAYDSTFKTFYDKNNKDVYFITKDYCLGYSEKLGQFTSFYDYNGVDTMFNIDSNFFAVKTVGFMNPYPFIWAQFKGEYNEIFGQKRPYSITYIENDEPLIDKVFTNIEYRADAFNSNNNYLDNVSFDTITAWNEYQEGSNSLVFSKYKPSSLKKKFRIWRANIPRDKTKKLDRMRNPWLFIKLSKENPSNERIELHDMLVHYFQ